MLASSGLYVQQSRAHGEQIVEIREVLKQCGTQADVEVSPILYAVFINRAFTWSGVSVLCSCSNRATAPATAGVAMLVPLKVK